ncbi:hypothetical protein EDB92DRAFT_812948 [Lactarius akahatsu]|uniref:Uncharacterized protein n=1 Tax=Lactarius akahatsu TaxID=416441 RepID=A0AAD4QCT8_9AGAM|nr:hypothetical protein EDB92DRAFT_812948 [Lactarius akahatsu]
MNLLRFDLKRDLRSGQGVKYLLFYLLSNRHRCPHSGYSRAWTFLPRSRGGRANGGSTNELLGTVPPFKFRTPGADAIPVIRELSSLPSRAGREETAAAALDVNLRRNSVPLSDGLSPKQRVQPLFTVFYDVLPMSIRFFVTVLQQMARADPMTVLLNPAAGGSMRS